MTPYGLIGIGNVVLKRGTIAWYYQTFIATNYYHVNKVNMGYLVSWRPLKEEFPIF